MIPTQAGVEAAWQAYATAIAPAIKNPALLLDRGHLQNVTAKEAAFKQAYLAWDGSSPAIR